MMTYNLLRLLHTSTVLITLVLFLLRGLWMLIDSPRLQRTWVRIVPHVNDTLLIVAALGMISIGPWSLLTPWIITKIAGLLAYIWLGTLALRRGRSKFQRIQAFIGALCVLAYIIAVAVTKQVIPGLI